MSCPSSGQTFAESGENGHPEVGVVDGGMAEVTDFGCCVIIFCASAVELRDGTNT
jgi:hypothetical protein